MPSSRPPAIRRRILSLLLPRLPTDRIRRHARFGGSPAAPDRPCVVVAKEHNALVLVALDDDAARRGLNTGMPLAHARAICPDLDTVDADPDADRALLEAVADWTDRFTPLVGIDPPHGLLLDITGCAHLFGGEAALLHRLCDGIARQGFVVSAAIAGTPACARAMARDTPDAIVPEGREAAAIAPLPVALLGADEAVMRGLHRAGLKTVGDVAMRAPTEISARFGMAFSAYLAEALGQADTPISPRRPPADFTVEKRFAEPVTNMDVVDATLASLTQMLASRMTLHGQGARRLEARFFRTDGAVHTVAVSAGQATRDAAVMAKLFNERLDALADPLDPGFGFDLICLAAHEAVRLDEAQRGFDTAAHEAEDVGRLVDRLAARIGTRRIVRYAPQDTHIPEHADEAIPAQRVAAAANAAPAPWPVRIAGEPPLRPPRLFARPERIEVTAMFPDGPPARFKWRRISHVIARSEGPERIAMEWWRGNGDILTRDYFRAEDQDGLRFWIYREGIQAREVTTFRWFLHGLFA